MKTQRALPSLFLALLIAFIPLQTAFAANQADELSALSITDSSGGHSGAVSALAVRDQNWSDNTPANYVKFTTPGTKKYSGYRTYQLPAGVARASVSALRVEANYYGPRKLYQTWTWSLYNWSTNTWVSVGNSGSAPAYEWRVLIFNVSNAQNYISSTGAIRVRLTSNNYNYDARIDYEAVHILSASSTPPISTTIPLPPTGKLYHGVYPGGVTGEEDDLTLGDVSAYESASGKTAGWVYFSDNWYHGRAFPTSTATWIRAHGSVPYVRLMLRSDPDGGRADPTYSLANILSGKFDNDLRAWCADARDFGTRLIAEYEVEMNGEWFPWNGVWNGAGTMTAYGSPTQPDGPERFRDAYRRIIQTCRDEGALNVTWVFHVNDGDWPEDAWNQFENYYPGDAWIDWLAVSSYGAQTPLDDYWPIFRDSMDAAYPRLAALSLSKPIIVAEFGVTANNPLGSQSQWAQAALTDITSFRWPRLIGFSWWNEWWQNDNNSAHDTDMRVQTNPLLAQIFQSLVAINPNVLGNIP